MKQLREWQAFHTLEPWGEENDDLQQAYTRKIIADVVGAKKKSGKPFSIYDLSFGKLRVEERNRVRGKVEPPRQSVEEMKQILKGIHGVSQANKGQSPFARKPRKMKFKRRKR